MNYPSRHPIEANTNPFTLSINPQSYSPSANYPHYNYHNNYVGNPSNEHKYANLSASRTEGPV